ncbi:MAG: hypothetical protein KAG66_18130 [Methylococcales bacterium]|nr:hypothetical protein [Methylococcales bacterium]
MAVFIISGIVSIILTVGMWLIFVAFSMIALNGFTSMSSAMPTFLIFSCVAWPVMVGINTFASWVITMIAKRRPFPKALILMNMLIVTIALGLAVLTAALG